MNARFGLVFGGIAVLSALGGWWFLHNKSLSLQTLPSIAKISLAPRDKAGAGDETDAEPAPKFESPVPDYTGMENFETAKVHIMTLPDHPALTAAVLRQMPAFRKKVATLAAEKEVSPVFTDKKLKTDFVDTVVKLLGDKKAKSALSKQYYVAYHRLNRRLPSEVIAIRRVYIFDLAKLKAELKAGAQRPNLAWLNYNPETDAIGWDFSFEEKIRLHTSVDMPIFIEVPARFESAETLVHKALDGYWAPALIQTSKKASARITYEFVDSVAGEAVNAVLPRKCPSWFSTGLRYFTDMTVLLQNGIGGTESEVTDNLDVLVPRANYIPRKEDVHLEEWVAGEGDRLTDGTYTAIAVNVFLRVTEKTGSPSWLPKVLARVRGRVEVDSNQLKKIFKDECGIDIAQLMPPVVDP